MRILKDKVFQNISTRQNFEILLQTGSGFLPKISSQAVWGTMGHPVNLRACGCCCCIQVWSPGQDYFWTLRRKSKGMIKTRSFFLSIKLGAVYFHPGEDEIARQQLLEPESSGEEKLLALLVHLQFSGTQGELFACNIHFQEEDRYPLGRAR